MMQEIAVGAVRSLVKALEPMPAPLALFRRLSDNGRRPYTLLLESAEPTSRQTQHSLLISSSALSIVARGRHVRISAHNQNGAGLLPYLRTQLSALSPVEREGGLEFEFSACPANLNETERLKFPSPLSVLREIAKALRPEADAPAEAVFLSGVFAYDLVAQYEALPEAKPGNEFPDFSFVLADELIVIDHLREQARIIVNVFGGVNAEQSYDSALVRIDRLTQTARYVQANPHSELVFARAAKQDLSSVRVDLSDEQFCATVERLKANIVAGDVFQIVPSRSFSLPCAEPLLAYASLRDLNPSPYLFYCHLGDYVLFGASPESAVKVDAPAGSIEISPIAGTRPRGFDSDGLLDRDLDGRLEAELRLDDKETAEHMMLVDLARNDVARVSEPGSRYVADLMRVDRYSHVMHLVSRVKGQLRADLDALHAYQASMNMGTLTGAPKIRAMQILRQVEGQRRGHYGGAIGYLRGDGSLDTAIVIRSALVKDGIATVRAGAGVVHDSVPALEADETRRKAEAVLRAIARSNVYAAEQAHD